MTELISIDIESVSIMRIAKMKNYPSSVVSKTVVTQIHVVSSKMSLPVYHQLIHFRRFFLETKTFWRLPDEKKQHKTEKEKKLSYKTFIKRAVILGSRPKGDEIMWYHLNHPKYMLMIL